MSYEGFTQHLCPTGHAWNVPEQYLSEFDDPPIKEKCPICSQESSWSNMVDDTNCDQYGVIEMVELTPAVECTCSCGHKHNKTEATYKPKCTREEAINNMRKEEREEEDRFWGEYKKDLEEMEAQQFKDGIT